MVVIVGPKRGVDEIELPSEDFLELTRKRIQELREMKPDPIEAGRRLQQYMQAAEQLPEFYVRINKELKIKKYLNALRSGLEHSNPYHFS